MKLKKIVASMAIGLLSAATYAGPFILAGTDADDHGYANTTENFDGWLFMQKGLENIAANVTNGNTTVAIMGSTSSAATAANSAFDKSSIFGTWNIQTIGTAGFADFFGGTSTVNINTVGILLMDSGSNVSGGVSGTNFVTYANGINAFVGAGGGLFSQANGYQWLTALLPSVTTPSESTTGLSLTAAGNSNFPGLTNADLSAGPYHERFEGYGAIPVLATSNSTGNAIIIGGVAGSITNPGGGTVPEPGSLLLVGAGLLALVSVYKKKSTQS